MKSLYICGDSFAVKDPEYGACWVELLENSVSDKFKVINLSRVCASNLQIGSQIDTAIKNQADFIIYLMTTSTREDIRHTEKTDNVINRYTDITNKQPDTDLTSYSIFSLDETTILSKSQLALLKKYHAEFFDLELSIYKNELIIEAILARLKNSNIPFVYDQGGFENTKFTGSADKIYFNHYLEYKSAVNLWNFVHAKKHRPYYHIEDMNIHKTVADYYYKKINET